MLLCKHCKKECKNENSVRNHERLCKENFNRVIKPKTQKWLDSQNANQINGPIPIIKLKKLLEKN